MPSYKPSADLSRSDPPPNLLDRVSDRIRRLGYAKRTELLYAHWTKGFILHHGKRHPVEMGKEEVESFMTSLAVERNVVAAKAVPISELAGGDLVEIEHSWSRCRWRRKTSVDKACIGAYDRIVSPGRTRLNRTGSRESSRLSPRWRTVV